MRLRLRARWSLCIARWRKSVKWKIRSYLKLNLLPRRNGKIIGNGKREWVYGDKGDQLLFAKWRKTLRRNQFQFINLMKWIENNKLVNKFSSNIGCVHFLKLHSMMYTGFFCFYVVLPYVLMFFMYMYVFFKI